MSNFWTNPGDVVKLPAPAGGVVALQGYLIGSLFVISKDTQTVDGDPFVGIVTGQLNIAKKSGETWADGDRLYWDDTTKEATNVGPADAYIATSVGGAAAADTAAPARLNGVGQADAQAPASASLFVSGIETGTGAPQNVAHGLGVVPSAVTVHIYSGHNGAGAVGDLTPQVTEGAHDATNVIVTLASGAEFKVTAYV